MKRLVFCAFFAMSIAALAGCNGASPTEPASAAPAAPSAISAKLEESAPSEGPGGIGEPGGETGGTGGETGGGTTGGGTTTPQYRITYGVYRDRIEGSKYVMKAYTQFERSVGGGWTRVDADSIQVYCYLNGFVFGTPLDGETESDASLVHITFDVQYQAGAVISCSHGANAASYTGTSSYTM